MLRFFRKIRRTLLINQRIGKYLLYVTGEILLVVIGILIALQINNANEKRKLESIELDYLQRLTTDLKKDQALLTQSISQKEAQIKAITKIQDLILFEPPDSFLSILDYINPAFTWQEFNPNQLTFKEMLSSGTLNLIQNDSIKNYLLDLDKQYSGVINRENTFKIEHTNTMEAFRNISFKPIYLLQNPKRDQQQPGSVSSYKIAAIKQLRQLASDHQFFNNLIGLAYNYHAQINNFKQIRTDLAKLIHSIELELANRRK